MMIRLFAICTLLFPAVAIAKSARVEPLVQGAGPEAVPRGFLPGLTDEVATSLRLSGYRVVENGDADEKWMGRLSVETKRYAHGKVFRVELERLGAAGKLLGAADKYAEIYVFDADFMRCPDVEQARWLSCGFQHVRYVTRWLVRLMLTGDSPTAPALRAPRPAPISAPASATASATATATATASATATAPLPAPSPAPDAPPDAPPDMVFISAGPFVMGSTFGEFDEEPRHTVDLDAFFIDRQEVSNEDYARCVTARKCRPSAFAHDRHYNAPKQPVVGVSWFDAKAYCRFAGDKRLPTEAEWEKAARGTDERRYPWGNQFRRDCVNLRSDVDGHAYTSPVGAFPCGASPYGALDMAGNAWEWCEDWWAPDYYAKGPAKNPRGPASSPRGRRVMRGGTWKYEVHFFVTTTNRSHTTPTNRVPYLGFRCAKSTE